LHATQNNVYDPWKYKGEVHPRTDHEGPEGEKRYSCTLSLTSALDWGGRRCGDGGQSYAPAALPPGMTRYDIGGWVGPRAGKSRPPPGFDPRTFQPVPSLYTYYAIPVHDPWKTNISTAA